MHELELAEARLSLRGRELELSQKQESMLLALLSTPTVEAAARMAGVNAATIYRNLRDPDFEAAYRAARSRALEVVLARLHDAASQAIDALVRNLNSGVPSVEVRAATTILAQALDSDRHYTEADTLVQIKAFLDQQGTL